VAGEGRPVLAVPGRSDRRLSKALRLQVPGEVPPGPGGLLGLELEFSVRSARGGRVDFGSLIHRLALDGTALDPGDPNAYRCSWGGVITGDGAEAEIATPVGAENLCHLGRCPAERGRSGQAPASAGPVLVRPEVG
jgi:hypothetical protein